MTGYSSPSFPPILRQRWGKVLIFLLERCKGAGIINSVDMTVSEFGKRVKGRETRPAAVGAVTKSGTWLSDCVTTEGASEAQEETRNAHLGKWIRSFHSAVFSSPVSLDELLKTKEGFWCCCYCLRNPFRSTQHHHPDPHFTSNGQLPLDGAKQRLGWDPSRLGGIWTDLFACPRLQTPVLVVPPGGFINPTITNGMFV